MENERFTLLCEKWKLYNPNITICFGTSYWNKFEKLFQLEHTTEQTQPFDWYRIYDSKIIFCPFFIGHKMTTAYKEQLGKEIQTLRRKWNTQ